MTNKPLTRAPPTPLTAAIALSPNKRGKKKKNKKAPKQNKMEKKKKIKDFHR